MASSGSFGFVELHKVYHVNLVLVVGRTGPDGREEEQMDRFRIVLDKTGVVRIEPVRVT